MDTSGQNRSCNCSGAFGLLCPTARASRVSRGRWSWCCGDVLPPTRCLASLSSCTWSACSETIFSPKTEKNTHSCNCVKYSQVIQKGNYFTNSFLSDYFLQIKLHVLFRMALKRIIVTNKSRTALLGACCFCRSPRALFPRLTVKAHERDSKRPRPGPKNSPRPLSSINGSFC